MDVQGLLAAIASDPDLSSERVDYLTNELLKEFFDGYPLANLRPLLKSENERLAKAAIWVASELGRKGEALLPDVFPLLKHRLKYLRFYAIDCILLWARPANQIELASVIPMIDDAEAAVRWKALSFMWRASSAQLEAALSFVSTRELDSNYLHGLEWLLSPDAADAEKVKVALRSSDGRVRKYAAVAAARMSGIDSSIISLAASNGDRDVEDFADSVLKIVSIDKKWKNRG